EEEMFGGVMSVMRYEEVDDVVEMGKDRVYGVGGYVVGEDEKRLKYVGEDIGAGEMRIKNGERD
ncbi:aldehyde dehydrogenase family protein, partial [Bacillus altitudinis]|uniref:aldehyde dehydrogenase family protein n=1 Tax=Bacillus altitudinis TaxID=293387 RepID=UPI0011A07A41